MFSAIEAREFIRYSDIKARELTKRVISTDLGSRLLLGSMAAFLGLSADQQANWQPDLSPQEQGHTISLDSHHLLSAPKYDPSLRVELPNIQVPVGEYETIKGIGSDGKEVEITRIYGEKDPDHRIPKLIILADGANLSMATLAMAKDLVGNGFFKADPMPNYLNDFTFWVTQSRPNEIVSPESVGQIIDRVISATGVIPLESYVFRKSNSNDFIDGGAVGSFYWDRPNPIHNYADITLPENLLANSSLRLVFDHEWLHLRGLADEYTKQGLYIALPGFRNCSRDPRLWGLEPTPFIGCEADKEAYRPTETSIMRELIPFVGEPNSQWLKETMNIFRWQQPGLKVKVASPTESFDKKIDTKIPYGTKRVWYQLIPPNNDGPGINLIISDPGEIERMRKEGLSILAPKLGEGNYVLLPGMKKYKFIVRISDSVEDIPEDSPKWRTYYPWPMRPAPLEPAVDYFSTPDRSSNGITAISPQNNELVVARKVPLQWGNKDQNVFYYEIQASRDCLFNTDPQTAIAAVWHNLVHGGESRPLNSWQTPELELGAEYCWRTRPRIQGDGTPVAWSETFRFSTPATLKGVVSTKQFLEDLNRVKMQERALNRSTDEHWNWVEREVLTKTEIPLFDDDDGEITTWISHSDNISFEA